MPSPPDSIFGKCFLLAAFFSVKRFSRSSRTLVRAVCARNASVDWVSKGSDASIVQLIAVVSRRHFRVSTNLGFGGKDWRPGSKRGAPYQLRLGFLGSSGMRCKKPFVRAAAGTPGMMPRSQPLRRRARVSAGAGAGAARHLTKRVDIAIIIQAQLTKGLSRSPITAKRPNIPKKPGAFGCRKFPKRGLK